MLDVANVDAAPAGPGWIVLSYDVPGVARQVVWVEWSESVFTRLTDMLSLPQESPALARWLESRARLRFRIGVAHERTGRRNAPVAAVADKELATAGADRLEAPGSSTAGTRR